jgi:hypothetical protein
MEKAYFDYKWSMFLLIVINYKLQSNSLYDQFQPSSAQQSFYGGHLALKTPIKSEEGPLSPDSHPFQGRRDLARLYTVDESQFYFTGVSNLTRRLFSGVQAKFLEQI